MKLGTWLLSLAQPMLAKILLSLGFSVVSIVGMESVINQVRDMLAAGIFGLSPDTLNLFLLAGGGKALGIIMGAVTTKVLLWQIGNATKILGVNPG